MLPADHDECLAEDAFLRQVRRFATNFGYFFLKEFYSSFEILIQNYLFLIYAGGACISISGGAHFNDE
jgi:hypothetical protein